MQARSCLQITRVFYPIAATEPNAPGRLTRSFSIAVSPQLGAKRGRTVLSFFVTRLLQTV
jgi:hypothetical protein